MRRARLLRSLPVAASVAMGLVPMIAGWMAWRRPDHVVAWLSLLPLCGT